MMNFLSQTKNFFENLNRNVFFLSLAQIFSMTSMNINIITTGLAGFIIAPYGWLSTFPLSLQFIITMLFTFPCSILMSKYGRKIVFVGGVLSVSTGGLIMTIALFQKNFYLFCFGSVLLGLGHATNLFYRYAATETVPKNVKPKAMSLVLSAGLIAALLGPRIYQISADAILPHLYAGSYLMIAITQLIALPFIMRIKIPLPPRSKIGGRKVFEIFYEKSMIKGVISAAGGYGIMSYLMTATPLQIINVCKFSIAENANIIQWHVIAMFAPSFFTGTLIQKFSAERILIIGLLSYIFVAIIAFAAEAPNQYLLALFLLGIGWNFLYIGGSTLIVNATKPEEQGKVQGISDLIIFGTVAFSSLSAGLAHYTLGWDKMVLYSLPIMAIILIVNMLKTN